MVLLAVEALAVPVALEEGDEVVPVDRVDLAAVDLVDRVDLAAVGLADREAVAGPRIERQDGWIDDSPESDSLKLAFWTTEPEDR